MGETVISVEGVSKAYQLGVINTRTFRDEMRRHIARLRGLPDPVLKIDDKKQSGRERETIWALKNINFTVQQGDTVGIIGRNGAGKSTLLKILSRITAPTSGVIKAKGKISSLLEIGIGFHPELTGRENIFLNGAIMGMKRQETQRKLDEIVDFSGVEKFIDTPVKRYSSGMYVRLAFAVAAHLDPEILILDEVLAVGDIEFQKKCLGKMGDVANEGRTVLFVSHNMAAVKSLCQKGILIEEGIIKLLGDMENVITQYTASETEITGTWFAKHTEHVMDNQAGRIVSVKVLNISGALTTTFGLTDPIVIEIGYLALVPGAILNISIHLHNSQDVEILVSPSFEKEGWGGNSHKVGLYTGRVVIPGGLLNQNQYKISVVLAINRSQAVEQFVKIVRFETIDFGEDRHGYFGPWTGVVRPKLNWEIKKED